VPSPYLYQKDSWTTHSLYFTTSPMGCGCPPLAVNMNINGRLSAVLALTSTGCTTSIRANWRLDNELDNSPSGAFCHILRTGYATYCSQGRVEERDAGDNLVRNSQVSCSPHKFPVGSRGVAVYSDARILPKETSASLCEAHSLEMWCLNHAPPAASTPLLATSFCMEGEPGDADVNDNCVYSGHAVNRHLGGILPPPSCARPPYVWRGGAA